MSAPFDDVEMKDAVRNDSFNSRQLSDISRVEASIDLSWKDIRYTVTTPDGPKELLKGVAGTAKAGRVLVIMGPSGAGKSTLLNAISGRLLLNNETQLDGIVCLNDVIFASELKAVMSFVAQDDIIMPKETPSDAFKFALAMKKSTRTQEEEDELVAAMLEKLRLKDAKDTIMGIPGVLKGVSGGEKKRTNIGVELITNPPIMMLDEPTSGLDSVSALRIGHLLRELAHTEGRTVICTLHTPSSELFQVFDDLMLMAKGHIIYHGPLSQAKEYFSKIGMPVPPRVNASEYYMRLLQSPADVLDGMARSWLEYAAAARASGTNPCVELPPTEIHEVNAQLTTLVEERQPSAMSRQLEFLARRAWRNTMRDPMLTWARVIQTLFFGGLIGLLYITLDKTDTAVQDRQGCLYLFVIQNCFMSLFPALLSFPAERPIFLQDMTSSLYNPTLYYISKVVVEFPLHMAIPAMYAIIVYFMANLLRTAEQFFIFLLITLCLSYCAQALGMLLSAIFEKAEVSLALGPLIMMPLVFVGGLFANTERLEPGWVWLEYLSFVRYAFKGMMRNEFLNLEGLHGPRYPTGESVIKFVGFDKHTDRWQVDVGVIIAMMIFLRILGCLALVYHARKQNSRLPYPDNFRKSRSGRVAASEPAHE